MCKLNAAGFESPLPVGWEDSGIKRIRGGTETCAFAKNVNISAYQGAFDYAMKNDWPAMQEEIRTPQETGDKAVSGCEEDPAQAADPTKPEKKPTLNCRDHCMHCGKHCIYLNIK